MRLITKDVQITIDGTPYSFRLTKLDAFSGVVLLRLLMRLEGENDHPTLLDLVSSLSEEELRSLMTAVLNHVSVILPAGPNPVMTEGEWTWPELKYDTVSCMKLLLEGISWSLSGFFGEGQSGEGTAAAAISP